MVDLQRPLKDEYLSIKADFAAISNDWKRYNDQIIPEDKAYAKRIIRFLINVIDFCIENFDTIDVIGYKEFLCFFEYDFFYGPQGDDRNYLDLDETLDGESMTEFCWDLKDSDSQLTVEGLVALKKKYLQLLSEFTSSS